jgi:hypothetical protein
MNIQTIYGWFLIVLAVLALIGDGFEDNMVTLGVVILIAAGWIIVDTQAKINNLEYDINVLMSENDDLEKALDDATR